MELQGPPHDDEVSVARAATRGSLIKLAAELAGRLMSLITTLAVARGLGVADFGTFAALSGIAVILAEAADLGLQAIAPRVLVTSEIRLRSLLRAKLVAGGLTALLALTLASAKPLLGVLLLFYVLAGGSEFVGVALRARGHRLAEALTIMCLRAFGLGLVALALHRHGGLLAVALALTVSAVPAIALGGSLLSLVKEDRGEDRSVAVLLRSTFPLAVNGILSLANLRLETLALKLLRLDVAAGLYAAAFQLIQALVLVPAAIVGGAMPALTREAVRGQGPVRERTSLTAALLAVPAAAGLILLASGILRLLLPDFVAAADLLRVVALALIPLFMSQILLQALIAAGRGHWLARLTAARLGLAVILAAALIPLAGAVGACVGFLTSETFLLLLAVRACRRAAFPVPVLRPVTTALVVSLPMIGAVVAASRLGTIAAIAVGVTVYAATLLLAWKRGLMLEILTRIDSSAS